METRETQNIEANPGISIYKYMYTNHKKKHNNINNNNNSNKKTITKIIYCYTVDVHQ